MQSLETSEPDGLATWRVCKYSCAERGPGGIPAWTAATDIGKTFQGRKLTWEEYLDMEDRYVRVALQFTRDAGLDALTVTALEDHGEPAEVQRTLGLATLFDEGPPLREGATLAGTEQKGPIDRACRLNLRELLWCRLSGPDGFVLEFGYDYYMYVTTAVPSEAAPQLGRGLGLYVEKLSYRPYSPQRQIGDPA